MSGFTTPNFAKWMILLSGAGGLAFALSGLSEAVFGWGFLLVVAFSVLVAPRMSLALPRSRFAISFSDSAVFLTFLLYGGPAAILVAALESASNCYYLRSQGYRFGRLMIPTNISISVISITITYLVWLNTPPAPFLSPDPGSTQHLIATLGSLAILQFLFSSSLAAFLFWLKEGASLWQIWKKDCFTSSMTHIVGAGLAGMIFSLVTFGDLVTGVIALISLSVAYLSYRQSIGEANSAMLQAEEAEREKAETERARRREAESHAEELSAMLEKEELANIALRKSEKDLQHAALYDALTDLPNRKLLSEKLGRLTEKYQLDPSDAFYVLFLDIRKFKHINDSLGHTVGDKVLMVVAKRFARLLTKKDTVARLGGDEFAIILNGVSSDGAAQKVARRILDNLSQPFSVSGHRISIDVNIGIASCDVEYATPEEILRDADIAMHYAKEKNIGVAIFTKDLRVKFLERVQLEKDLRHAIDRNELALNYQPIVDISDGSTLGFEVLLRWQHAELGPIRPDKFIPIAEESGLIIPITRWIIEHACLQLSRWQKIGASYANLLISVNISGTHLSNDDLIADVENALELSNLDSSNLKLEITESAAMENPEFTIDILKRLNKLGVQLSIDDFGTGYSSLNYLHRLPFDTLKIDRSFVNAVDEENGNSEILQTIISLAKSLKKKVIAEGIETDAQLELLRRLGCDYGQGYLFSRPQTKEIIENTLYTGKGWFPEAAISDDLHDKRPADEIDSHLIV